MLVLSIGDLNRGGDPLVQAQMTVDFKGNPRIRDVIEPAGNCRDNNQGDTDGTGDGWPSVQRRELDSNPGHGGERTADGDTPDRAANRFGTPTRRGEVGDLSAKLTARVTPQSHTSNHSCSTGSSANSGTAG